MKAAPGSVSGEPAEEPYELRMRCLHSFAAS